MPNRPGQQKVQGGAGALTVRRAELERLLALNSADPHAEHLFGEGRHWRLYEKLGAHLRDLGGVGGVSFAVWAPSADGVSVVGDFNNWDGRLHQMRRLGVSGVWEIFVPEVGAGALY